MYCLQVFAALAFSIVLLDNRFLYANGELRQVHALFRHGDRTCSRTETYPTDPYVNETYYPYGRAELTNDGKRRLYEVGTSLRRLYDEFLGPLYTPDLLHSVTTDRSRTKMSLMMVMAGLFNPTGTVLEWDADLAWQPIPYDYVPFSRDTILPSPYRYCPKYHEEFNLVLRSNQGVKSQENFKDLFDYLTKHTGKKINSTNDVLPLYITLTIQKEWGFELPAWTISVFPILMKRAAIVQYYLASATPTLKQLSGGFFLRKVIGDMNATIQGNLNPAGRKLFLYAAHEVNLAFVLNALEVFFPHTPPYGAYVLIELHEIQGRFAVKILYEDYSAPEARPLKIPGCELYCPMSEFISILQDNIPDDDQTCN